MPSLRALQQACGLANHLWHNETLHGCGAPVCELWLNDWWHLVVTPGPTEFLRWSHGERVQTRPPGAEIRATPSRFTLASSLNRPADWNRPVPALRPASGLRRNVLILRTNFQNASWALFLLSDGPISFVVGCHSSRGVGGIAVGPWGGCCWLFLDFDRSRWMVWSDAPKLAANSGTV